MNSRPQECLKLLQEQGSQLQKKSLYQISEHSILFSFLSSFLHPNKKISAVYQFISFINTWGLKPGGNFLDNKVVR
jgi:hypothetical protein